MFSPEQVKKAIQDDLSTSVDTPTGKGQLMTFVNTNKVEIALATKMTDHWHVELIASHSWAGDNSVGAVSKFEW